MIANPSRPGKFETPRSRRREEADLKKFEDSIAPQPKKADFNKVTPFTPEEERLYGKPAAPAP